MYMHVRLLMKTETRTRADAGGGHAAGESLAIEFVMDRHMVT